MTSVYSPEAVAEFENATWSRCAKSYSGGFALLTGEAIEPMLRDLTIVKEERVLDIGTGPGLVAATAAKQGAKVLGIDFSEAMVSEARRRHPELEFSHGSAESLEFQHAAFDKLTGNFVLHHSGNPSALLQEANRVLKPAGKMALTIWDDMSKLEAFGLFFAAVTEHSDGADLPHGPLFGVSDRTTLCKMVETAGFQDVQVKGLELEWKMHSIDSLLMAFYDWANMAALPEDVQHAIETSVRANAKRYLCKQGFVIPNPALLITATKE